MTLYLCPPRFYPSYKLILKRFNMLNVPFNNGGCFNLSFYSLRVFYSYKNKRRAILNFSLSPIEAHAHRPIVFYRGTTLSLSYPCFRLIVIEASKHRPYVCPFLHSSVRLSDTRTLFRIILRHRDVFRFIFTSFVMYFRSFLRHSFHFAPIVHLIQN